MPVGLASLIPLEDESNRLVEGGGFFSHRMPSSAVLVSAVYLPAAKTGYSVELITNRHKSVLLN
jgi:hypothetical protein